jgi:hypothetical protein
MPCCGMFVHLCDSRHIIAQGLIMADAPKRLAESEREIGERVYRLYGLTAAEIKIVERACP